MKLYLASKDTKEYIGSRDLTDQDLNPKYHPETHAESDQYIFDPRTASLIEPMEAAENQKQILGSEGWELVDDYRGDSFWDTATKAKYVITTLGVAPGSGWTDQEPDTWQIWNGSTWEDDLALWIDKVVRPERDARMNAFDWRIARYHRETDLGLSHIDDLNTLHIYMQALADMPDTLMVVADVITWPVEPV